MPRALVPGSSLAARRVHTAFEVAEQGGQVVGCEKGEICIVWVFMRDQTIAS